MSGNGLVLFGGFLLGAAIACLAAFFLSRFTVFNAKVLGSVCSIIAGGVVTAFLGVGKEYAWIGYCSGLGSILVLFIVPSMLFGRLRLQGGRDARLKMLDELHKRYTSRVIEKDEYNELKKAIFADIKPPPTLPDSNP